MEPTQWNNEFGFYENADPWHLVDQKLKQALVDFFIDEHAISVADFGCGNGEYLKAFKEIGMFCEGYDGNPHTEKLTNGLGKVQMLHVKFFTRLFDWVVALEVGEHIDAKYEDAFINNLCSHATEGIILSWAIPGQQGDGHVNCRTNEYIKQKMKEKGFHSVDNLEVLFRSHVSTCEWFKNTIMVFRRFNVDIEEDIIC